MTELDIANPCPSHPGRNLYYAVSAALGATGGAIAKYVDGAPNNPADYARHGEIQSAIGTTEKVVETSRDMVDFLIEYRGTNDPAVTVLRSEIAQDEEHVATLQVEASHLDTTTQHEPVSVVTGALAGAAIMVSVAGTLHGINWAQRNISWLQKIR